jgi:DNA repair exonuclease SbcCD ATPase subunit
VWAKLVRCGGAEENLAIPAVIPLTDVENYIGRFSQPVANTENKFNHENQFVIPCMFVSSTHFCISVAHTNQSDKRRYTIRDYSRNGTFLNDKLVGNTETELVDGAEISLKYKEKVRVAYRFTVLEYYPTVRQERTSVKTGENSSVSLDVATELLTQQISALQQEAQQFEHKLQNQSQQIQELTDSLDKSLKKTRNDEKQLALQRTEIVELKERVTAAEGNATAIQARNIILEDNYKDEQEEVRNLRHKLHQCQDELRDKTVQLESRRKVIDEGNRAISHEKSLRMKLESTLQLLHHDVEEVQEKNMRLTGANHALQDIVNDIEQQLHTAQVSFESTIYAVRFGRKMHFWRGMCPGFNFTDLSI